MTVFWFLLYAQKERHGGEPYRLCLCKRLRDAEGDHKLDLKILFSTFLFCLVKKEKAAFLRLFFVVETHGLEPWTSCV